MTAPQRPEKRAQVRGCTCQRTHPSQCPVHATAPTYEDVVGQDGAR